jgi:glycosyltransferase involved in cell wall biosynthesis
MFRSTGPATVPPTLLCSVIFPANTGFAWDFIERLYARMADKLLEEQGVRTIVAYPAIAEPPRTLAGSAAIPVVLDTELRTLRARASMVQFVRRENVQVLYLTDRPLWSPWYRSLRSAGVRRIIVHDHTSGVRTVPTGIRRAVKRALVRVPGVAADVVIAVSDFVAERDRAVALIAPESVRRVWNGVDPIQPDSEADRPDVRTLLGLSHDTPVIGCACRAAPEKGVDVLFKAFDLVCRTNASPPVLAYIGTGPESNRLAELRDSLQSANRIHMLGYLSGASGLLRTANVCVVPSVWEDAFPLAVLEMMARGRAVVATRVGGIPEMIEDGRSGLLVTRTDVNALAEALTRVLESPSLQNTLGRAARDRASRMFTANQQLEQLVGTFEDAFVN